MRITTVAIQRCHTNSTEDVYVPGSKKHPHFFAVFRKLHAKTPVRPCPIDAARQNLKIRPIQDDGLKQATNWMHARMHATKYGAKTNTNQDLVTWLRNIHVDTDNRQSKLRPELVHQLITSAQT